MDSKGITESGTALVLELGDEEVKVAPSKDKEFEAFWKAYPSSDAFGNWPETRKIKRYSKKGEVMAAFLIARQKSSKEEIMLGLTNYIDDLKKKSLRENKLNYMVSPTRFLKECMWEDYSKASSNEVMQSYGNQLA